MISEASYDRIVNAIYEAALDPKVWSEVIHELLASFQTRFASVYTPFAAKGGFEPIWSTNGAPLFERVAPLPERAEALRLPHAAAIAFVSESSAPMVQKVVHAVRLYRLTPAEGRVLQCLVTGLNVQATASALGTAASTVRTQAKSILAKSGASRHAELVRLVAMLV